MSRHPHPGPVLTQVAGDPAVVKVTPTLVVIGDLALVHDTYTPGESATAAFVDRKQS